MALHGCLNENSPVRRISILAAATGIASLLAAVVVVLWPLNVTGVTGNALRPTYVEYGWASYSNAPLPAHPTHAQMRAAGIPVPSDTVGNRRHISEVLAVVGAGLVLGSVTWRRRRAPTTRPAVA